MADKISELTEDINASNNDLLVVVDSADSATKKMTIGNLIASISGEEIKDVVTSVTVSGSTLTVVRRDSIGTERTEDYSISGGSVSGLTNVAYNSSTHQLTFTLADGSDQVIDLSGLAGGGNGGGGGSQDISQLFKDASVSGSTLTLTRQDDTTLEIVLPTGSTINLDSNLSQLDLVVTNPDNIPPTTAVTIYTDDDGNRIAKRLDGTPFNVAAGEDESEEIVTINPLTIYFTKAFTSGSTPESRRGSVVFTDSTTPIRDVKQFDLPGEGNKKLVTYLTRPKVRPAIDAPQKIIGNAFPEAERYPEFSSSSFDSESDFADNARQGTTSSSNYNWYLIIEERNSSGQTEYWNYYRISRNPYSASSTWSGLEDSLFDDSRSVINFKILDGKCYLAFTANLKPPAGVSLGSRSFEVNSYSIKFDLGSGGYKYLSISFYAYWQVYLSNNIIIRNNYAYFFHSIMSGNSSYLYGTVNRVLLTPASSLSQFNGLNSSSGWNDSWNYNSQIATSVNGYTSCAWYNSTLFVNHHTQGLISFDYADAFNIDNDRTRLNVHTTYHNNSNERTLTPNDLTAMAVYNNTNNLLFITAREVAGVITISQTQALMNENGTYTIGDTVTRSITIDDPTDLESYGLSVETENSLAPFIIAKVSEDGYKTFRISVPESAFATPNKFLGFLRDLTHVAVNNNARIEGFSGLIPGQTYGINEQGELEASNLNYVSIADSDTSLIIKQDAFSSVEIIHTQSGAADIQTDSSLEGNGTLSDPLGVTNPVTQDDVRKLNAFGVRAIQTTVNNSIASDATDYVGAPSIGGTMWGSPWVYTNDSSVATVIYHALAEVGVACANLASVTNVKYVVEDLGSQTDFPDHTACEGTAQAHTSSSYSTPYNAHRISEIQFTDPADNQTKYFVYDEVNEEYVDTTTTTTTTYGANGNERLELSNVPLENFPSGLRGGGSGTSAVPFFVAVADSDARAALTTSDIADGGLLNVVATDEFFRVAHDEGSLDFTPYLNSKLVRLSSDNQRVEEGWLVLSGSDVYLATSTVFNVSTTDDLDADANFTKITGGDGGSGLASVSTNASLTGDGTVGSPLAVANPFTQAQEDKLASVEENATADQTAGEIKTALEGLSGDARLASSAVKGLPKPSFITVADTNARFAIGQANIRDGGIVRVIDGDRLFLVEYDNLGGVEFSPYLNTKLFLPTATAQRVEEGWLVLHNDKVYLAKQTATSVTSSTNFATETANFRDLTESGGGSGGGLEAVTTDATITGDGTSGSPLSVANPFTQDQENKLAAIEAGAQVNVKPSFLVVDENNDRADIGQAQIVDGGIVRVVDGDRLFTVDYDNLGGVVFNPYPNAKLFRPTATGQRVEEGWLVLHSGNVYLARVTLTDISTSSDFTNTDNFINLSGGGGGGGLETVATDATLSGDGTADSPLSVARNVRTNFTIGSHLGVSGQAQTSQRLITLPNNTTLNDYDRITFRIEWPVSGSSINTTGTITLHIPEFISLTQNEWDALPAAATARGASLFHVEANPSTMNGNSTSFNIRLRDANTAAPVQMSGATITNVVGVS